MRPPPPTRVPLNTMRSIIAPLILRPVKTVPEPEKLASVKSTFGPTRYPPEIVVGRME